MKDKPKLKLCYARAEKLSQALEFVNVNLTPKMLVSFRYVPMTEFENEFYEIIYWKETND